MKVLLNLVFVVGIICLVGNVDSQDKKLEGKKAVTVPYSKGQVLNKKFDTLPKFDKPNPTHPHHHRPPNHPGHSWHWHKWHGWVAVPITVAPNVILLPDNYRLPQTVLYYVPEPVQIVCPHCGNVVLVNVK